MTALRRLAAAFVEPAASPAAPWTPPIVSSAAAEPRLAVLCRPRDARLAAGAVGLALLRREAVGTVVVCEWGAEARGPAPPLAWPAAVRRAGVLAEHGLAARAEGRLVRVTLPDAEAAAAREAALVSDEGLGPVVLVVAGTRAAELDTALRGHAGAVVVRPPGDDATFADLAADELRSQLPVALAGLHAPLTARVLARNGLALLEPLRGELSEALAAVA